MIFSLKRWQQRKNSWMALRAIDRLNGYDIKESSQSPLCQSLEDQKGAHFLTS